MVLFTVAFAGCAGPEKRTPVAIREAPPGTAVIYFFRPIGDQVAAGSSESANWNQSAEFKVDEGVTYYVALWHQNQPTATPSHISLTYGAVGYLVFQALHPPQGSAAARLEPVQRDIAEYGLAGLRFVTPTNEAMTPP